MPDEFHDPLLFLAQLRQTLSADKLSLGFLIGAGCPCAVRVKDDATGGDRPIIPDIRGLTEDVRAKLAASATSGQAQEKLAKVFADDGEADPTIEAMLNRIRALRDVAGKVSVRDLSFDELNELDREICQSIREIATCDLPPKSTPYHALARFIRDHRYPFLEIFTTNYDVLMEQALEACRVPYFDGFVGSYRPFFDQRAIEDDTMPARWSRLWKLHGSINWRLNKRTKSVLRTSNSGEGDELLIHPSHLKYDDSRRMPYFVMIDRLRRFLRNDERPVALIALGYSFGDEHINEAIIESLRANASSACFALQFDTLSAYADARALGMDNANLSVLAPDKAIIRRRELPWMATPATDVGALGGAFEVSAEPSSPGGNANGVTDVVTSDVPRPCRFLVGDFRYFGDFLDQFCGYTMPVTAGPTE